MVVSGVVGLRGSSEAGVRVELRVGKSGRKGGREGWKGGWWWGWWGWVVSDGGASGDQP